MNISQQRAVDFKDGTMLLLAGPGSGKTSVLTHRIKALMDSGVRDSDILVITFTKAAALEMQERFMHLLAPKSANVSFGTFHAIFYSILRHHRAYRKVAPIKDKEKINMIKRALEISSLTDECADHDDLLRALGLISSCKNNGNDPSVFTQDMFDVQDFERLFNAYDGLLHDFGMIDFDDMINECLKLLKKDREFCFFWQKKFKYILIDEFQDISASQYELVKILAYPENNIFAVGDDDQSIYGFRGANISLMHRLLEEIPGAVRNELDINYRSVKKIVEAAGLVISENKDRFEKNITAYRCDETGRVTITSCIGKERENEEVVKIIKHKLEAGIPPDEIAILTRTNRVGGEYAALILSEGIACSFTDPHIPFSSEHIKDLRAYMAVASGDNKRANFLRIVNRPVRYIKRDSMPYEYVQKEELLRYYAKDPYMVRRINELFSNIKRLKTMSPYLGLKFICNAMGYDRYVKENVSADKYNEYLSEKESFGALIKKAGSYRDMEEMLYVVREKAIENSSRKGEEYGIKIMTYHGSKGLEFDTVILPDVNENKTPSKAAHTPAEIDEERRMFYVAMTRAKNSLNMLYRTDENLKPSRFIDKIIKK
ncbi:MAG: ATP-dependent helicase [Lachnospiraceae bacterium]|nr:ATP-dependent helicase [Lachnospiraceae bacterium]